MGSSEFGDALRPRLSDLRDALQGQDRVGFRNALRPRSSNLEMHLKPGSSEFGDALRTGSSELQHALGAQDRAMLDIQLETEIE